jgi:hypothetical protein
MSRSTAAGLRPAEPATQDATVRPFQVSVPDEDLVELRRRLASARWPSKELVADQSQGVQLATLQALARYWATDYGLRRIEARPNALPQFRTEIDGVDIHFLHVKSPHEHALPLLITHGWPGSVIELLEVIGPLTDPTADGGAATDAFTLVADYVQTIIGGLDTKPAIIPGVTEIVELKGRGHALTIDAAGARSPTSPWSSSSDSPAHRLLGCPSAHSVAAA